MTVAEQVGIYLGVSSISFLASGCLVLAGFTNPISAVLITAGLGIGLWSVITKE
ncbi:hypothetical protein H6G96_32570 [Nostoc sp. FACHB-892]|uniref:hypothetical protein n=1 Tax=Nostoc sp. FACHB-892 TaxID=2692843 RepID=UPI001689C275|nr:hypothetical protein [Nostoc sp. FACHB-892]MBD2730927.1 hypothetical protein [Nostoc sp. FACHB-892]